jgi:hypothetical protein
VEISGIVPGYSGLQSGSDPNNNPVNITACTDCDQLMGTFYCNWDTVIPGINTNNFGYQNFPYPIMGDPNQQEPACGWGDNFPTPLQITWKVNGGGFNNSDMGTEVDFLMVTLVEAREANLGGSSQENPAYLYYNGTYLLEVAYWASAGTDYGYAKQAVWATQLSSSKEKCVEINALELPIHYWWGSQYFGEFYPPDAIGNGCDLSNSTATITAIPWGQSEDSGSMGIMKPLALPTVRNMVKPKTPCATCEKQAEIRRRLNALKGRK